MMRGKLFAIAALLLFTSILSSCARVIRSPGDELSLFHWRGVFDNGNSAELDFDGDNASLSLKGDGLSLELSGIYAVTDDTLILCDRESGANYSFGYRASGTPEVLMHEGLKHGFGLHVQEPYKIDGVVVSSTYIREFITDGRMEEATKFMGRMYAIGGEVIVGNKLGRTIGFPTMNLVIDETMITPPNGVYITYCTVDGVRYPAVTNVGNKPTIGEYAKNIETHIFNFDEDTYGKHINVEFVKWTRPEQKFAGIEELKNQIQSDCIQAKAYHRERGML